MQLAVALDRSINVMDQLKSAAMCGKHVIDTLELAGSHLGAQ
jgi:hypothetical protein